MKKWLFLSLWLFVLPFVVLGQKTSKSSRAIKHYKFAMDAARDKVYDKALVFVEKAIEIDENFAEAYALQGDVYQQIGKDSLAAVSYRKAISVNPSHSFPLYYRVAIVEHRIGEFANALQHIEFYLSYSKIPASYRRKALELQKRYEFAVQAVENPVMFEPFSLGDSVNTLNDEYLPAITADGENLIFTKSFREYGVRKEDFYQTYKNEDGEWEEAFALGPPINTSNNEGAQCITADGNTIIYTACSRSDGYGDCDLYISHKVDGAWTEPENLGSNINTEAWESQPSISSDGRRLFFSSGREGGLGGKDIWVAYKNYKGYWTKARNLGPQVNTNSDEISPFIHWDNQTLYYASKGKIGMGGYDIFYTKPNEETGKWEEATNLGYPVNTQKDENSLVVAKDGKTAYFAAENLENGRADLDLYRFELPEESRAKDVAYVQGFITDAESRLPIGASIQINDLASDTTLLELKAMDYEGTFFACLPADKNYSLNVFRDGYLFHSEHFSFEGDLEKQRIFVINILLKKIRVGELVRLENIFFEHDSYELAPASTIELNRIVAFLNQNISPVIEISGHTDDTGTSQYNMNLSEKRAKAIWQALKQRGVPDERITYKGYGATQPVTENESEGGRARNRRTELKIIKP